MFRFTIRDLLWLTVVVAMGTGWLLEYRRYRDEQVAWSQRGYQIQVNLLYEIKTLQEANRTLEYREADREMKERLLKFQRGELPPPPYISS